MPDEDPFHDISPVEVLRQIASAVPAACKPYIVVIGSLAAGYPYFGDREDMQVRTKDADCLLAPRSVAVEQAQVVANLLIAAGWEPVTNDRAPGTVATAANQLPVIRLRSPHDRRWFIELLTSTNNTDARGYEAVETVNGHYCLASFPYLALASHDATEFQGIRVAKPSALALVNLLNHPGLTTETMSAQIGERTLYRCAKDLGRVLAITYLQLQQDRDRGIDTWIGEWTRALQTCYATHASELAQRTGSGLQALLGDRVYLDHALHSCVHGLLHSFPKVTTDLLTAAGERLLADVIRPVARDLQGWSPA